MSEPAKAPSAPPAPPPTSTSSAGPQSTPASTAQKAKPTAPAASRTNSNTSNGSAGRRGGQNARNRGPGAAKKEAAGGAAATNAVASDKTTLPATSSGKQTSTPPASATAGGSGAAVNRRKSHTGQQSTGRNAPRPAAPAKQNSAPALPPSASAAAAAPALAVSVPDPRKAKTKTAASASVKGGRSNSNSSASAAPAAKGSDMLDSLKRVITDLKAMPQTANGGATVAPASADPVAPASADPGSQVKKVASPQAAPAAIAPSPPSPVVGSKAPNPNAPTFHPSRQPLDQLSEEVEPVAPRMQVPGGAAAAARQLPQGVQPQQPMGQFSAPRFQSIQKQATPVEPEVLGPTGRPVLAPTFTFGQRRQSAGQEAQQQQLLQQQAAMAAMSFDDVQQVVARSQSFAIGSDPPAPVVAPGMSALLGLAARAHRRTGSEMSPQMAQQVRLQQQIEELQRQQRDLLLSASQQAAPQAAPSMPMSFAGRPPHLQQIGAHRRIQSVAAAPTVNTFGELPPAVPRSSFSQFQPGQAAQQPTHRQQPSLTGFNPVELGLDAQGHSRSASFQRGHKAGQFSVNGPFDWASEEYSAMGPPQFPNGGGALSHSRQSSRAMDSSWRMNGGVGPAPNGNVGGSVGADLAQAQAQLQSIAAFRAAAGGGHSKMASFALPNMLPNMLYANAQTFFNIPQQMQAFQTQIQQQSQQTQRRSLFSPYLPAASLPPLLAAGKLVIGVLRVNKRNRSDAYVATEVLDADIYISGSRDRNRALDGDTVAIELLDVDEVWASKKEKEDKKRKKEENAAFSDSRAIGQAAQRKTDKRKDDVEVEGQGMMLFDDEEVTDEVKPQYAGHVVAVVERMPGQLFSGTLGLLRPSSAATKEKQEAERRDREGPGAEKPRPAERPKIVWFKPTDKRVPLIAISTEQAPNDFLDNADHYANVLFCACIKRWPITSLHPFGTLVEEVGPIGQVEVETSALLKDCNFPSEEFSEAVLKCLPPMPWSIPDHEYETRRDMRKTRVFTIDPSTAKDLDDALSITATEDGNYEVGVHIADVSHFVKTNTALDRDARKKATSVYLVQRAVPMLPPALSEELCSLVPDVERLAFSAFFTMSKDGRVLGSSFSKTIIKSCAKLAYEDAQAVIEGKALGDSPISDGFEKKDIEEDIRLLNAMAVKMAERRIENGALRIDKLKLNFQLNDKGLPVDCSAYERKAANSLVEEFMLLANMTVATTIAANLPEQALLRRHEAPLERRLEGFSQKAARLGLPVDVSSGGAISTSFNQIKDPASRKLLEVMSTKAMHRAKYFCSGMLDIAKYSHYALNAPLYTHFTSPIRRYADIVVHRQLAACLEEGSAESKFAMDRDTVAKTAQNCNMKKDGAKLAQEQSAHLFLCLLIQDLTEKFGPVVREANVVNVLDQAFDVVIPEFGIEKRVHADQMPLENIVYDEHSSILQLYWSEKDVLAFIAERDDDEHLHKVRKSGAAAAEISTRAQDESALFEDDEEEATEEIVDKSGIRKAMPAAKSIQQAKSAAREAPAFEGLRTLNSGSHKIQDIKEFTRVPVIITADLEKSPPVIKVFAVNPYSKAAVASAAP